MKYLIFSDIHGNADAFTAMMEAIKNEYFDGYIFCGDLTGYYYDASLIVKMLPKLQPLYGVRGNHDEMYCQLARNRVCQACLIEKFGHSYAQIDFDVVKYIESLPTALKFTIQGYQVLLVHGSPQDPIHGRLYPDTVIGSIPDHFNFVICGHTHYRMFRQIGSCNLINPGSLGQPRDGMGFSYAKLDIDRREVSFYSVKFNQNLLTQKIALYDQHNHYLKKILFRKRTEPYETHFYY